MLCLRRRQQQDQITMSLLITLVANSKRYAERDTDTEYDDSKLARINSFYMLAYTHIQ